MYDFKELGAYGLAEFMVKEYKDYNSLPTYHHHVRDIDACDIAMDVFQAARLQVGDCMYWAVREHGTVCACSDDVFKRYHAHYGHEFNYVYKIKLNFEGQFDVCTLDDADVRELLS